LKIVEPNLVCWQNILSKTQPKRCHSMNPLGLS
jgi:hypothetical protein